MKLPPFKFLLWGKVWQVRYGEKPRRGKKSRFASGKLLGQCDATNRVIYLHPKLRKTKHRLELWKTWAHELLHAFDHTTKGATGPRGLKHPQIDRLESPFGSWLLENMVSDESLPRRVPSRRAGSVPNAPVRLRDKPASS